MRYATNLGEGRALSPPRDLRYERKLGEVLLVAQVSGTAARMGFQAGQLVLEIGHGGDCDSELRSDIEKTIESTILSGDVNEVVDAVLLWFRESDGDLVDELVDGLTYLSESGPIWVLTPKAGRPGHVEASDIQDAAPTAGLTQTTSIPVAADWSATRLVARKSGKR